MVVGGISDSMCFYVGKMSIEWASTLDSHTQCKLDVSNFCNRLITDEARIQREYIPLRKKKKNDKKEQKNFSSVLHVSSCFVLYVVQLSWATHS